MDWNNKKSDIFLSLSGMWVVGDAMLLWKIRKENILYECSFIQFVLFWQHLLTKKLSPSEWSTGNETCKNSYQTTCLGTVYAGPLFLSNVCSLDENLWTKNIYFMGGRREIQAGIRTTVANVLM